MVYARFITKSIGKHFWPKGIMYLSEVVAICSEGRSQNLGQTLQDLAIKTWHYQSEASKF